MAKVVFMERSDQAGAFQKVMRTAETEIDSFGASGSGPMHEKLRAAYDSFLRGHPNLDPEQCFALAWNGLSLSDQDQIRAEETGEYQERLAEEARLRQSVTRANGREIENTMKHEQVSILLKAVRGVLADDELTKAEREDVLRETFDDYADRTGRDGLKDIASIPAASFDEPDLTKADTRHALAMAVLEGKAEALRKVNPSLTREAGVQPRLHRSGPMPSSPRSNVPQTRHGSRNRRPSRTDPITCKRTLRSQSATTRSWTP